MVRVLFSRNFASRENFRITVISTFRTDCDLQRRIELLSRSIMCAKSSTSRTSTAVEGEFLHELEEKMEVKHIIHHQ